ncbi:MAG TPA: acyl-CoA dehydrogenase [Rhizomicrobium sp.]
MSFRAPVSDLSHALRVAGLDALLGKAPFADVDRETIDAVLSGAAEFAEGVVAPINRGGDIAGARLENGRVVTAPGFADAYRKYCDGGWSGLSSVPEFGGQGLPRALSLAVFEIIQAANVSFGLCPMLSEAAMHLLAAQGTDNQKRRYLRPLVSGAWTGTMNLTEPQAGSDLAQIRTRAEPDGAHYRITGQKIFISWGDHDLAENIIHLVLARLPDAPPGVKGISLFLVPRVLVDESGKPGAANTLQPLSLEHKMGLHASPTCVMSFEGALGEIVGAPGQGLALMFLMMSEARLNVGVQGVGVAERATQAALSFARSRRQGRSPWNSEYPAMIFDLPDVRRMLMLMKAKTEAARAICLATAVAADLAEHAPTPHAREAAKLREEFLVPIAKAWSSDVSVEVASLGVQVHGGAGFIEETGAAQYYRDARVLPIYEGTNGIQAIDLAGRKLGLGNGAAVRALIVEMRATAVDAIIKKTFVTAVAAAERASDWMIAQRGGVDSLGAATTYLKLMGDVIGGWMLAKSATLAVGDVAQGKFAIARFYAAQVLTQAPGLADAIEQGAAELQNSAVFPPE